MSHFYYELYKHEEFYNFYNEKHKVFFQQLKTKFKALCYVAFYSQCLQIEIFNIFNGDYNDIMKSYFKLSKSRNEGKIPVFIDLNQEIVKYLQLNCLKEYRLEKRSYILAVDLNKDKVEEKITNETFHEYITSAIEGSTFRTGYNLNKDISDDIIINPFSQNRNKVLKSQHEFRQVNKQ